MKRRQYLDDLDLLRNADKESESLFAKLQAFRAALDTDTGVREPPDEYDDRGLF